MVLSIVLVSPAAFPLFPIFIIHDKKNWFPESLVSWIVLTRNINFKHIANACKNKVIFSIIYDSQQLPDLNFWYISCEDISPGQSLYLTKSLSFPDISKITPLCHLYPCFEENKNGWLPSPLIHHYKKSLALSSHPISNWELHLFPTPISPISSTDLEPFTSHISSLHFFDVVLLISLWKYFFSSGGLSPK